MARIRWQSHEREHRLNERALRLQAKEYERRLETLNHENARILDAQSTYVRKDNFESAHKELGLRLDAGMHEQDVRRDEMLRRIAELEKASIALRAITEEKEKALVLLQTDHSRRLTLTMWGIGLAITILNIALGFVLHFIR